MTASAMMVEIDYVREEGKESKSVAACCNNNDNWV